MEINKSLVKGSFILLLAYGLFSFFHFAFQLAMARMLTLSEYGVLAPLSAIIIIFLIFNESVQTVITKYSSKEKQEGKLKNLLKRSIKKAFLISLLFYVLYLILAIPLAFILKIDYILIAFTGLMIFVTFIIPIPRGIMQGKEKFKSLGISMIFESSGKLILGIVFVYFGFKVFGAIAGIVLAGFLAIIFSFAQLKTIMKSKEENMDTAGIYSYAKSTFLITSLVVIFYSLDVIVAKIAFPPEIAGAYALASTLGKIIFWGTLPISKAMFPMSADHKENKKHSENILINAFGILSLGIAAALVIFYLFPDFIIRIFSGKVVPEAISVLFYVGVAFGIIAFANLILLYKLSLGKIKGYQYLIFIVLIEIVLLWMFKGNIVQFSLAFITASAAFLWGVIMLIDD